MKLISGGFKALTVTAMSLALMAGGATAALAYHGSRYDVPGASAATRAGVASGSSNLPVAVWYLAVAAIVVIGLVAARSWKGSGRMARGEVA